MGNVRAPLDFLTAATAGDPNVRAPLVFTGGLTGGVPDVRAPLVHAGAVTGGNPDVRNPLTVATPLTGGNPNVRCALIVVQAVIPVPEEAPVATAVFPTLKGLTWDISKNPEFNTAVRQATSGRETRTAFRAYPIWHFELAYSWLPDYSNASGYQQTDYRVLQDFFLARQGKFGAFLFRDIDDYHVVGGTIATGDAVTLQWPFYRQFGAEFLEPVGQVDLSTLATFAATAVNTTTDAINVPAHGLTNGQGPLFVSNAGGSLPTGLAATTPYWAIVVDADHFQLATNQPNALAATAIDITAQGSGTDKLTKGWAAYETITETDSVPGVGPYTVTVAHAASFVSDGGVTISGTALTKVAGAPAANQYSEAAGVYTFNSAQASASAAITYTYLATNASLTLPNQLVFAVAPASGAKITADFDFWYVCRFEEDVTELKQFASKFWDLEKLTFQSVIQ